MKTLLIVVAAVVVVVAVALAVLGSVDIPAPSGQIEKPISADKLPH